MNCFEVVERDGHHSCFLNDFVFQPVKMYSPSAFFFLFFLYIEVVNGSEVPLGLIRRTQERAHKQGRKFNKTYKTVLECFCKWHIRMSSIRNRVKVNNWPIAMNFPNSMTIYIRTFFFFSVLERAQQTVSGCMDVSVLFGTLCSHLSEIQTLQAKVLHSLEQLCQSTSVITYSYELEVEGCSNSLDICLVRLLQQNTLPRGSSDPLHAGRVVSSPLQYKHDLFCFFL